MGCQKHLQWSPIKEESVETSQGISPRGGLKGKRQREKGSPVFSASPSSSNILSARVSFCKCCSKVFFLIGRM